MESDKNVRKSLTHLPWDQVLRGLCINGDLPHNEKSCRATNVAFAMFAERVPSHLWVDMINSPTLNTSMATTHALMELTTLNPRDQSKVIRRHGGGEKI